MSINIIVAAVTLVMGGFVGVWVLCPRCRPWLEGTQVATAWVGTTDGLRFLT